MKLPLFGGKEKPAVQNVEHLEFGEFKKYKQSLSKIRKLIESYHSELGMLNPLNEEYINTLGVFTEKADAGQRARVVREGEITGGIKRAYNSSRKSYQELILRIEKVQTELSHLDNKLKEHDELLKVKNHYNLKIDQLKKKSNESVRMQRNMKKNTEADQKFEDIDSFIKTEMKRLMDSRFDFIESIVHEYTQQLRQYHIDSSVNMRIVEKSLEQIKQHAPPSPSSPISPTSPLLPVVPTGQSSSMISILSVLNVEEPVNMTPVNAIIIDLGSPSPQRELAPVPEDPVGLVASAEEPVEALPLVPVAVTPPLVPIEPPVEAVALVAVAEEPVEALALVPLVATPPLAPIEAPVEGVVPVAVPEEPVEALPLDRVVSTPPLAPVEAPVEAVRSALEPKSGHRKKNNKKRH
jgi:hypothetical protein